jgi:hypothetical protein
MIKRKNTKKQAAKRKPSKRELDDALVAIIASTKRKKRKLNALEVAEKIETAWESLESLSKVADRTKMSTEMLRQIHSVRNCSEQVKELVRERKLESYDILHRISKLPAPNQVTVAKAVIAGELNSEDVRAIVSFYRDIAGGISIARAIERIKSSRNIKQYVVYFQLESKNIKFGVLRSRFEKIFGKANIVSLEEDDGIGELVLNVEGRKRLEEAAKSKRMRKRKFIQTIVARE